ncbi:MAG: hypothetical protein LBP37_01295, partial [Spirochaetaceae bacterium]|nr:hypothetical protein [Spirochaetaceae bacterium]
HENHEFIPPPPRNISLSSRVFSLIFTLIERVAFLRKIAGHLKNFIVVPGIWGRVAVKRLEKKGYKPIYNTEKIAFVIVIDWALDHLENIISSLNNNEYDLVYINLGELKCRNYASSHNCNVFSIQNVVKRKLCYRLAVTTHAGNGDGDNFNFGIELIASEIMLVASLIDFDYCNLANINQANYIVCANDYQKNQFEKMVNKISYL